MNSQNVLFQIDDPLSVEQLTKSVDGVEQTHTHHHFCKFCNRYFRFKDLYDQHNITCEYFYRRTRDREREMDTYEKLPSPHDQFKLIQYLVLQVNKLQKEVIKLKGDTISKKRKIILEWLHSPCSPIPMTSFQQWIKLIPVEYTHLLKVFEGDLTDGMKLCLSDYFKKNAAFTGVNMSSGLGSGVDISVSTSASENVTVVPICAFLQKSGTIYIWSDLDVEGGISRWCILSNDEFDKWINRLAHRFLQEFIQWQMDNSERIHSNDEEKEKNIEYMRKINGLGKIYEDRRRSELRKWLFSFLAKDFTHMVDYDFV